MARIHEGKKTEKIKCRICEKLFASKCSLKEQIPVVHDGKKLFKCDFCNNSCATQFKLKTHFRKLMKKIIEINIGLEKTCVHDGEKFVIFLIVIKISKDYR